MTFKHATDLLAVPLQDVAIAVGRTYGTVLSYRNGQRTAPPEVMRALASFMAQHSEGLTTAAAEVVKLTEELEG